MVKLNGLHPPTLDTKSNSDLPMTGEETGLGTSTPPLAGYLGKVQDRCASLENCPWCNAKGLTFALRSYRINLLESITLCTNTQCLFPLVSRSLDDVLANLVPPATQSQTQPVSQIQPVGKRKNLSGSEPEEEKPVSHAAKGQCSEAGDRPALQNGDVASLRKPLPADKTTVGLDDLCPVAKDNKVNGYHKDSDWPVARDDTYQEELGDMELEEVVALEKEALSGPIGDFSAEPFPASVETPVSAGSSSSDPSARSSPVTLQCKEEEEEEEESVMALQDEAAPWLAPAERGEESPPAAIAPPCDARTFIEEEEEEELRAVEESGNREGLLEAILRPCSVDLSQSRVPEEEEERRKRTPAAERPDSLSGTAPSNRIRLQSEAEVISSEADDPRPKTRKRTRQDAMARAGKGAEPGKEEDSQEFQAPLGKRPTSRVRDGKRSPARKKAPTHREERGKKKKEAGTVSARSAIDLLERISASAGASRQEEEEGEEEQPQPAPQRGAERARSVAAPAVLFWKNRSNMCWLDVLLVTLVNCRTLRGAGPPEDPENSPVWSVLRRYDRALALLQTHQRVGRWGVQRVSVAVWKQVKSLLEELRLDTFKLLQPRLQRKLGQKDTPVFAMPLLLKMDAWADPFFQLSFSWKQECTSCKHTNNHRHVDVLPSFGPVASDWLPLNATQPVSCQACSDKQQFRMMSLESVPPVFALHFVEGLPDNDMAAYSFRFHGRLFSVTTVLQYGLLQKHFVAWVHQPDGTWLEIDGLKYPHCATHSKLEVPPKEIHLVFWEEEPLPRELLSTCSPTTAPLDSPVPRNKPSRSQTAKELIRDKAAILLEKSHLSSLPAPRDDHVDIVQALTVSAADAMETAAAPGVDASIGSATLLDTFEGLTHEDIVTLTLVEVKVDAEEARGDLNGDSSPSGHAAAPPPLPPPPLPPPPVPEEVPAYTSILDVRSLPPSSDCPSPGLDPDLLAQSPAVLQSPPDPLNSSESEPEPETNSANESSDPTFEPSSKRRRTSRAKVRTPRPLAKAKPTNRAAPPVRPGASAAKPAAARTVTAPPELILPSVVGGGGRAANDPLAPPAGRPLKSPEQNSRVSFLLGAGPGCSQVSTSTPLSAPAPRPPVPELHPSTGAPKHVPHSPAPPPKRLSPPVPVRSPAPPVSRGTYPKPLLRTGEGKALPVKAAEMFGGFSSRAAPAQPPSRYAPTSPSRPPGKPLAFAPAPPRLLGVTRLPPSPPRGRSSATPPPGLTDTEALRYKLLKKLKAKKKKLEKLNMKLGEKPGAAVSGGEPGRESDSAPPISQYTVSSSTSAYNSPAYDEFFAELLSPSTTASNLSPDSTGYLEMLANGQEGGGDSAYAGNPIGGELVARQHFKKHETATQQLVSNGSIATAGEHFLEEFIGERAIQPQSELEREALNALDLFF